jgi:hypothetical protein
VTTNSSSIWIAAYANLFCTNATGSAVYYREIDWPSPDLSILTNNILNAYPSYLSFNATDAFVITWYNVQSVTTPGQLNTFQMILVTDNVNSFVIYEYVRLDSPSQMTCVSSNPLNGSYATSVTLSLNCSAGGTLVEVVNTAGKN